MIFENHRVVKAAPDNMSYERPWLKFYGKETLPNVQYPDKILYEMLVDTAKATPDNVAIEFMGTKISYSQLLAAVDCCAKGLKEIGFGENDIFTVGLPNVPHAIIIFYAINKVGGIVNMIHPLSAPREIQYAMELTKSKYYITTDFLYKNVKAVRNEIDAKKIIICKMADYLSTILSIGFWATSGRKIPKIVYEGDAVLTPWKDVMAKGKASSVEVSNTKKVNDGAVILYSGGTTGKQKGILLSNMNFNALAIQTASHQEEVVTSAKFMCIMPLFHGFGLGICMHTPVVFGATIILVPKFNADEFAKVFAKQKPNFIAGVPTLYEGLLRSEVMKKADFSCLKGAFAGGDALPEDIKRRFDAFMKERGGTIELQEGFGLTETVTASCLMPKALYKPGSVGIPYPDTLYKIFEHGTEIPCETGVDGEICISGPSCMLEYYNEPEETAMVRKVHADGRVWIHTGDMGHMDEDGFVFFKLRIKRIIKSSGYSVFPTQIEEVINKHEAVVMSCVIGVPDDYQIEKIKAFIVLKDGYEKNQEMKDSILKLCREYLAKWSTPREIEFRDSLPTTKVGKIAYTELEKEAWNEKETKK